VPVRDRHHAGDITATRQHMHLLRLVKLIPERMRRDAGAMQAHKPVVGDLTDHKTGNVHRTRHHASWCATADTANQVAHDIALPAG
jgi:hypothetical protein